MKYKHDFEYKTINMTPTQLAHNVFNHETYEFASRMPLYIYNVHWNIQACIVVFV